MTVCSCHVTYAFQSESTLYSCLNVKELLARSRRKIWSLSDCNWTRTHDHLVQRRTLNHSAKILQPFDMVRTYSQMHRTDKYSQHSSKLLLFFLHYLTVLLFYSIVWKIPEKGKSRFFFLKSCNLKFNVTWTMEKYVLSQTWEYDY